MPGMETHDTPCTAEDRQRIVDAALARRAWLRLLANDLEGHPLGENWTPILRRMAAKAIRQLIGEEA